jgi:hypothetical protein
VKNIPSFLDLVAHWRAGVKYAVSGPYRLRLPFHNMLTISDLAYEICRIREFGGV